MTYEFRYEFTYMKNIVKSYLKSWVPRLQMQFWISYAFLNFQCLEWFFQNLQYPMINLQLIEFQVFWSCNTKGFKLPGLSSVPSLVYNQLEPYNLKDSDQPETWLWISAPRLTLSLIFWIGKVQVHGLPLPVRVWACRCGLPGPPQPQPEPVRPRLSLAARRGARPLWPARGPAPPG